MSGATIVIAKQNRYIRAFRRAGATSMKKARTLEEIGCRESFIFNNMVARGIFVECENGRYYLDEEKVAGFISARRNIALIMLILMALVTIIICIQER